MAISIRAVSAILYDTDKTDHTVTLNAAITAGETAILINGGTAAEVAGFDNNFTSVDDAGGGTWSRDLHETGDTDHKASSIWSCYMPNGMANGATFAAHGTHSSPTCQVFALSGLGAVPNQADRFAGGSSQRYWYSDTPTSYELTPSADGCIILGYIHDGGALTSGVFWTPGAGWTEISDMAQASPGGTGSGSTHAVQWRVQTTAAAVTSTGTARSATSQWTHAIVAYKTSGATTKTGVGIVGS